MLLYSENITPRLEYIAGFLLKDCLGLEFRLTNDSSEFSQYKGPGLNYSGIDTGHFPVVIPYGLLSEKGIRDQQPRVEDWEGTPCFFRTSDQGELPFDLFSAAFWMVSRYEEYHTVSTDQHGRFPAEASLAERSGFLGKPVVSIWARKLGELLKKHFPGMHIAKPAFSFLSTIDIDVAWAYKYRPWWRVAGASFRDLVSWQWKTLWDRILVLAGFREDPYEVYTYLEIIHRRCGLKPIYFFLVGDYGSFGKNVDLYHPAMMALVENLEEQGSIGLHPSYDSSENPELIKEEKHRLEKVTGRKVTDSRQHYLRLSIPDTFRELVRVGIERDYSLGFAGKPGFRAGTAQPFRFYDIEKEKEEPLTLIPLVLMDGTLREYMQLGEEEALGISLGLLDEVRQAGGTFTCLWHNHTLSDTGPWKGWRGVFEELLAYEGIRIHDQAP